MDSKVQAMGIFQGKVIKEYIIDEIVIKTGSELVWIWVVIESTNEEILSFYISRERNMYLLKT